MIKTNSSKDLFTNNKTFFVPACLYVVFLKNIGIFILLYTFFLWILKKSLRFKGFGSWKENEVAGLIVFSK